MGGFHWQVAVGCDGDYQDESIVVFLLGTDYRVSIDHHEVDAPPPFTQRGEVTVLAYPAGHINALYNITVNMEGCHWPCVELPDDDRRWRRRAKPISPSEPPPGLDTPPNHHHAPKMTQTTSATTDS